MDDKEVTDMLGNAIDPNHGADAVGTLREPLLGVGWQPWVLFLVAAGIGTAIALGGHYLLAAGSTRLAKRSASPIGALAVSYLSQPVRWLMVIVAILFVMNDLYIQEGPGQLLEHLLVLLLIVVVSWLLIRAADLLNATICLRSNVDVKDDLRARKIQTQLSVLRRLMPSGPSCAASSKAPSDGTGKSARSR
jgi:hypothetical protein